LLLLANPSIAPAMMAQNAPQSSVEWSRALYTNEGLQISPIPASAVEAAVIGRYGGPGSLVYTGTEASEHRIKTDRLDRFRIIHFATHGLVSQQRPMRSALVLATTEGDNEDGFLQAREIYNLKLASDLVVLSACQTARGKVLRAEGIEGLARDFFMPGRNP
jgi:CHAT domain-containing protein